MATHGAPCVPAAPRRLQASSSAPADEEELFELTKYFIQNGGYFGPFTDKSLELISEDFIFRGPRAHTSPLA